MVASLILPKPIQEELVDARHARFVIAPLYPGYGMTLGNTLRRILLSSLPGCAASAFSIEGVSHEFSALNDVKEDVVDIMLNLKQVRFRMLGDHDEPVKVELDFKGNGPVTAAAFQMPTGISCVTPDVLLATVTASKGSFHMTAYLTRGRGFLAVESREKERLEIGTIAIDAIYTPVRHVAFSLDHVRVGQMTNYDRVTLTVETDGSITPTEAMHEALTILRAQVSGLMFETEVVEVSVEDVAMASHSSSEDAEEKIVEEASVHDDEDKAKKKGKKKSE